MALSDFLMVGRRANLNSGKLSISFVSSFNALSLTGDTANIPTIVGGGIDTLPVGPEVPMLMWFLDSAGMDTFSLSHDDDVKELFVAWVLVCSSLGVKGRAECSTKIDDARDSGEDIG